MGTDDDSSDIAWDSDDDDDDDDENLTIEADLLQTENGMLKRGSL